MLRKRCVIWDLGNVFVGLWRAVCVLSDGL